MVLILNDYVLGWVSMTTLKCYFSGSYLQLQKFDCPIDDLVWSPKAQNRRERKTVSLEVIVGGTCNHGPLPSMLMAPGSGR